jgi:hypothetical protein
LRRYALALAALLRTISARADAAEVSLDCSPLGEELRGQVEARLRATLLADGVSVVRVALTCPEFVATADVERDGRVARRRIASNARALADALLVAADQALLDVASAPEATPAAESAAPESPSPPRASSKSAPQRTPRSRSVQRDSVEPPGSASAAQRREAAAPRFRAEGLLERWTGQWAVGGSAALEDRMQSYRYGFSVGALTPTSATPYFNAVELFGVISVGIAGPELGGLHVSSSAGLSGLFAQPSNGAAGGTTDLLAIVFGLDLSYPIWFGQVALTPGVGGRAFTADRNVVVDSVKKVELSGFVAHASLALIFRAGE